MLILFTISLCGDSFHSNVHDFPSPALNYKLIKEENARLKSQLKEAEEAAKKSASALDKEQKRGMFPVYICFTFY